MDVGHIFNSNYNHSMTSKGPIRVIVNGVFYERVEDDDDTCARSKIKDTDGYTYNVYQNVHGAKAYVSPSFAFMIPINGEDVETEYVTLRYKLDRGSYATALNYDTEKYNMKFDDNARIVFQERASGKTVVWFLWE
jgi:tRNA(Glu) U13 pseudouridine synthase TruD